MFVIDQVPYKAALETAVANVEVAKASLATAELLRIKVQRNCMQRRWSPALTCRQLKMSI